MSLLQSADFNLVHSLSSYRKWGLVGRNHPSGVLPGEFTNAVTQRGHLVQIYFLFVDLIASTEESES